MTAAEITRLEALAEVHDLVHQGCRMRWRGFGAGAPLVLLHGGHGSWLHWVQNIEPLAAAWRVWVPDLPGFGDSDDLGLEAHAPERLALLVELLGAAVDQLVGARTPVGVAGFSFGGLVAAHLAVRRGGVDRLALIGPGGHGLHRRQRLALDDWRLPDPAARAAALRANLVAFMLHDEAAADELAIAVHTRSCEATRFRSRAISRTGGLQALLQAFEPPLLALWGEHDLTGEPDAIGDSLCRGRAHRRWCVLPGAGHWVQYEAAAAVNRLLVGWFGGQA